MQDPAKKKNQVQIHVLALLVMATASSRHCCSKGAVFCPYSYQFWTLLSRHRRLMGNTDLPFLPLEGEEPHERTRIPLGVLSSRDTKIFLNQEQLPNGKGRLICCPAEGFRPFFGFCLEYKEGKCTASTSPPKGWVVMLSEMHWPVADGLLSGQFRTRSSLFVARNPYILSGISLRFRDSFAFSSSG